MKKFVFTMDQSTELDGRICEDRNGYYAVLFSNYNYLEMDEIGEIFGKFGQYLGIRAAGNKAGIHFVTYETIEEAKNAIEGLENHPDIQLKIHRKKKPYNRRRDYQNDDYNNNIYNNRRINTGRYNHPRRRMINDEYYGPMYVRKECIKNKENHSAEDSLENSEYRESSVCNETSARSVDVSLRKLIVPASDYYERKESNKDDKSWSNVQDYLAYRNNRNIHENRQVASVETTAATINTESEQLVKNDKKDDQSEDEGVGIKTEEDDEDSTSLIQEIVYAKASEVIVGNVDPRLNEAYLLYLFHKYEPIAVSQLVPLPRGNARYCHVYFKKHEDTLNVERRFDKLYLAGRQLVVQRTRRMIATYLEGL